MHLFLNKDAFGVEQIALVKTKFNYKVEFERCYN